MGMGPSAHESLSFSWVSEPKETWRFLDPNEAIAPWKSPLEEGHGPGPTLGWVPVRLATGAVTRPVTSVTRGTRCMRYAVPESEPVEPGAPSLGHRENEAPKALAQLR